MQLLHRAIKLKIKHIFWGLVKIHTGSKVCEEGRVLSRRGEIPRPTVKSG